MAQLRTERGLDRLVNFSDAAVAIAITLLILPLVDFAPEIAHEDLGALVADHWSVILALVISFAVIGNLWLAHHQLFELVADYNYGLVWLNLLWLFSIVIIPFATNVLASSDPGQRDVYALYIGTIVLSSGSMVLMRLVLKSNPELVRSEVLGQLQIVRASVPTAVLALALVLSVAFPGVGVYWLFLLFLEGPVNRAIGRAQARRSGDRSS